MGTVQKGRGHLPVVRGRDHRTDGRSCPVPRAWRGADASTQRIRTYFDSRRFAAGRKWDIRSGNFGDQSARHTAQGEQRRWLYSPGDLRETSSIYVSESSSFCPVGLEKSKSWSFRLLPVVLSIIRGF